MTAGRPRLRAGLRRARHAAVAALAAAAALAGGVIALTTYGEERRLSAGRIGLAVDLARDGTLDGYVPLLDWGVRFDAVRLPARLKVEVRTIDRATAARLVEGDPVDVGAVRAELRDAVAGYIRRLLVVVLLGSAAIGALTALALRSRGGPHPLLTLAAALGAAVLGTAAVGLLLPPRGPIDAPEYYARGSDIPVALRTVESALGSSERLRDELDAQLVGLARLATVPAGRADLRPLPRLVLASDLHNNLLALPALERAAAETPLLFAGDLTSSGSPFETRLVRRVVRAGRPFAYVSGNHDSDQLARRLAQAGGIVLTERGRLLPDGSLGPVVNEIGGLRVAGYGDPNRRRAEDGYRDRGANATPAQQQAFADWLGPLVGKVDAVLVHSPALAARATRSLRISPPRRPLLLLTGHTHVRDLQQSENLTVLNGGTVGGGGTGNFEKGQPFGLALLTYARAPFRPLAADLVEIDPQSGSARAERRVLEAAGG